MLTLSAQPSDIVPVYNSRHDRTGAAAARNTSSASACHNCSACTDAIDGTEHGLHIRGGQHSHDDASDPVGNNSHGNHRQHDRDHIASISARQFIDYGMQLYAGRSAGQWRGFAALDPRGSEQPFAWHDSTGGHRACRHQHRSDHGGGADAEHVGMRRERDHESGDARHDGTCQRHGRRGDPGPIAGIAIGLLKSSGL